MIYLLVGSMTSFVWALTMLFLTDYTFGVFLTNVVSDYRRRNADLESEDIQRMAGFFGSMASSTTSLFMAITGGVDWNEVVGPLQSNISPLMLPLFSCYIAFCVLVLLNLVTGVFVDGAQRIIKDDKAKEQLKVLRKLFQKHSETNPVCTRDEDLEVTKTMFEASLEDPEMVTFFEKLHFTM